MIHVFAKESKLIIIFFLTVIVLGSLLVYLSINNVSNYKELTEKKILEQHRDLANQFLIDFQSELESLTTTTESFASDSLSNEQWIESIYAISEIKQLLITNKNGAFVRPHFVFSNNTSSENKLSLNFLKFVQEAEHAEFVTQDYQKAEIGYLSALKKTKSRLDSVYALNAVSRLYTKMNKYNLAYTNYALILSQFSNVSNTSGFPFAYFSVNQLLAIEDSDKKENIHRLLEGFLLELSDGEIPLNFYTSEVMSGVLKWVAEYSGDHNINTLESLVEDVSNKLLLVNNYRDEIAQSNTEISMRSTDLFVGNFKVMNPVSGDTEEVLLFNQNEEFSVGFTISLETIFKKIENKLDQDDLKFEYVIELVNTKGKPYFSNNNLSHVSVFSPYFNQHRINISLKNESILEALVLKRKLIYGIGFLLLLGLMAVGLILLSQDIKRKRQIERLRSDFVSNVTHELKTPLTSIHMFADSILLGRVKSDADLKKYANIIVRESENLKRMINNILEFSRKENNKLVYQIKEVNLSDLIKTSLDEMTYWLEINEFKVSIEIEENVFAKVEPDGIKQVISNLISNAIKYSASNKELIVRLFKKKKQVYIEIEDFGIGIPKDKLNLIFEKFYRVNSIENESVSGTGLGLTVTRDIIQAQNGELLVESTMGKGSKFTIVFNV